MNVVGKVGSLISQGVYTVATPFHPFGGAVDVIVVQQPDGTFRSTPWYVRFGKFQGVLKGAEKIVSIEVNGVGANFHMYLDACGEAYFVRDADSDRVSQRKGALSTSSSHYISRNDNVCTLEHSFSDAGASRPRNEFDGVRGQLERTETRFYDFQDEQEPLEVLDNLSECDSYHRGSLDGEPIGETVGSDPEVVLVSVDGHMITAPVRDSDLTIENVQAATPRFHLESSEAKVLFEGKEEFNSRENKWFNGHARDSSTINEPCDKASSTNDDLHVLGHGLEVYEGQVENSLGTQELRNLSREDGPCELRNVEEASGNEEGDVSQSCLEVSELPAVTESNNSEEAGCTLEIDRSDEIGSHFLLKEETGGSALKERDEYEKSCDPESHSGDGSASSQTKVEPIDKVVLDAENEEALDSETAAPVLGAAVFDLDSSVEPTNAVPLEKSDIIDSKDDSVTISTSSRRRWSLWPIPFKRVKATECSTSTLSNDDAFMDSEPDMQISEVESEISGPRIESPRKLFIRTNVPTSEQIESLNLNDGLNMVTFSFSTRMLGRQQVDAHIFLWKWDAKIVISDVDGTITKSDVLGQFMPLVGKDWTQTGVTHLFSAIRENGYQLLFLSARAIAQAYLTRNFLLNLKQDGKALPTGPVVISPDGLFPSLFREVIRRAPHEFKIACLEDIKKLFPPDHNPFYAGFGNRDTDELSYLKMGIPKGKIFIINPKGEVAISHHIGIRSYTSLHTLVNDMFPPTCVVEQEDYNMWNYWKMPLPDLVH